MKKPIKTKPKSRREVAAKPSQLVVAKSVSNARYTEGVGRRKTAVARVRLVAKGAGRIVINDRTLENYFPPRRFQEKVRSPLRALQAETYDVTVKVYGGGTHAQAEAVRHGIARALVLLDEESKKKLRGLGFLTRDPRMVERKKYGLKKARRAPQWAKR
jgi:small subunit ribosomal protein S9